MGNNVLRAEPFAGNRTPEELNGAQTPFTFNPVNQMTNQGGGTPKNFTYDLNGNMTGDGTRTYTWDGANRLVSMSEPFGAGSKKTEFTYDPFGRRLRITNKVNTTVVSDNRYIWDNSEIIEERTADTFNATPTRRFFPHGVQEVATGGATSNYFYARDHLGSIREMVDATGTVVAKYDYDMWGRQTKLSGTKDAAFGYCGYWYHKPAGLYLTWYRAYDPNLARWLSRDPIGENGGMNLYGYVSNTPISATDPTGLHKQDKWYGYDDPHFRMWFHRCYKPNIPGGPLQADKPTLDQAYQEWLKDGSPKNGKCGSKEPGEKSWERERGRRRERDKHRCFKSNPDEPFPIWLPIPPPPFIPGGPRPPSVPAGIPPLSPVFPTVLPPVPIPVFCIVFPALCAQDNML